MRGQFSPATRVILDYDGTLTLEDAQAEMLRERSLNHLAEEVLDCSRETLESDYQETQARLLASAAGHGWVVNDQLAAYCDEGAFILNTSTMQALLSSKPAYRAAVERKYKAGEYEPVMACVNDLFHRFTYDLPPFFRSDCVGTLIQLLEWPHVEPVILTNSRGDKVRRTMAELEMPLLPANRGAGNGRSIRILGDVRQYDMSADWPPANDHGLPAFLQVDASRRVDLRRPVYHRALLGERRDVENLIVVADGFSLAGSLPLQLGIPFLLVRASYTPDWVLRYVERHPYGQVLDQLGDVLTHIDQETEL